jgi:tRNA(Arg) A34 adenosine deaminase TadA
MQDQEIKSYLQRAIACAKDGINSGKGGPFGCLIVKDGVVIAEASNQVISDLDPTAHAEITAIRQACKVLGSFQLDGCILFSSTEPCPMCLGAIYWARPLRVYYASTRKDAADAGFDDDFIYRELNLPQPERSIPFQQVALPEGRAVFEEWKEKRNKQEY